MVCEWLVGGVKNSLKTLGGNYTEETIDKKMKATSLVNSMLDQDARSLMIETRGPGTSWDRFEPEEVERFKSYVSKLNPFRLAYLCAFFSVYIILFRPSEREPVSYPNKIVPRSLYSSLSEDLISKFFNMKLKNMY